MLFICLLPLLLALCEAGLPGFEVSDGDSDIRHQHEDAAKVYLALFGFFPNIVHLPIQPPSPPTNISPKQFRDALVLFQSQYLLPVTGIVDNPTMAKMNEFRCGNWDLYKTEGLVDPIPALLWKKKALTWALEGQPISIDLQETTEAIRQAFSKWAPFTAFTFTQVPLSAKPDITITFTDKTDALHNVVGYASKPTEGKIILHSGRQWGYRRHSIMGVSIFHTMLHEIGHILGMKHTFYRGSIMFPMMKPALLSPDRLDNIQPVDQLAFAKLYGYSQPNISLTEDDFDKSKCPKYTDGIVDVSNDEWVFFRNLQAWKISVRGNQRNFIGEGRPINQMFPRGPSFINATARVVKGNEAIIILISERSIYGYTYNGVEFAQHHDFPKQLHSRVLFYPQAAFSLGNGSLTLLAGNVFASYDIYGNYPKILEDKQKYFPNLPAELRSGVMQVPGVPDSYYMFDEATVTDYDMNAKQARTFTSLLDFIKCNK